MAVRELFVFALMVGVMGTGLVGHKKGWIEDYDVVWNTTDYDWRRQQWRWGREDAKKNGKQAIRFDRDFSSKRQFPVWSASVAQVLNLGSRKNAGIGYYLCIFAKASSIILVINYIESRVLFPAQFKAEDVSQEDDDTISVVNFRTNKKSKESRSKVKPTKTAWT